MSQSHFRRFYTLEDEIEENQTKTVGSDYKNKFQRAIDLQKLAKFSPAIIAERNKIREKYGEVTWDKLPSYLQAFDSLRFAPPALAVTAQKSLQNTPNESIKTEPVVKSSVPPTPKKSQKMERSSGFSR